MIGWIISAVALGFLVGYITAGRMAVAIMQHANRASALKIDDLKWQNENQ